MSRRCTYADATLRGSRSPECSPDERARYSVPRYFLRPRPHALYLCDAHAEHHAHLSPKPLRAGGSKGGAR